MSRTDRALRITVAVVSIFLLSTPGLVPLVAEEHMHLIEYLPETCDEIIQEPIVCRDNCPTIPGCTLTTCASGCAGGFGYYDCWYTCS